MAATELSVPIFMPSNTRFSAFMDAKVVNEKLKSPRFFKQLHTQKRFFLLILLTVTSLYGVNLFNFTMDRACFERIYADYYKVLRLFAMRIVGDMSHAEDIVQEVFTDCWENRKRIDASVPIKSDRKSVV